MNKAYKLSKLYFPTLKEDSAEAELASHKLLLRAGMIRKTASGIYSFLPLGNRVLNKVKNIIKDEMAKIDSQEVLLPIVQPAELWKESGRWDVYGPELARLTDRHGREFCLGPTHEEIITALVRGDLRSYKELPTSLYQVNMKFRDEIRPRFGLMRGREFIMKDAYSFHSSPESLRAHYEEQSQAYANYCTRLGLEYRAVEADSGQIGGKVTKEYLALAEAGEAELVYCKCGYAANTEVGEAVIVRENVSDVEVEMREVHTPGTSTIAALAEFMGVKTCETVKALAAKDADGRLLLFFIPGDRELNTIKAEKLYGPLTMLEDEDFKAFGVVKGFIGPVAAPKDAIILADRSLMNEKSWLIGANKVDYHLDGACPGRDFEVDHFDDFTVVTRGDKCPRCMFRLREARGIEVAQVFELGQTYSEALNATYLDENGKAQHFHMGCYGVGVSRSMAAVIEQHNDERGIKWPISVAPYEIAVLPLAKEGEELFVEAEKIADKLAEKYEVVFDDRAERPGVKFAEAELIGYPLQVVLGKKSFEAGLAEIKIRKIGEKREVALDTLEDEVEAIISELWAELEV